MINTCENCEKPWEPYEETVCFECQEEHEKLYERVREKLRSERDQFRDANKKLVEALTKMKGLKMSPGAEWIRDNALEELGEL